MTDGKVLWETGPTLDAEGRTAGVPFGKFWWTFGIKLRPDHVYRVIVVYENPTDELIPGGGMGVVGGVFKPSEEWPAVDPNDPLYAANMEKTIKTAEMRSMGMDMTHGAGQEQEGGHVHNR